jgi:hypothetical protein
VQAGSQPVDYLVVAEADCFFEKGWTDFLLDCFVAAKLAGLIVDEPFISQL